jgi:hypothetical protein
MNTKRIGHRIYALTFEGVVWNIDGQNHEGGSNEWQVFEITDLGSEWWETFDTKREALDWIMGR